MIVAYIVVGLAIIVLLLLNLARGREVELSRLFAHPAQASNAESPPGPRPLAR